MEKYDYSATSTSSMKIVFYIKTNVDISRAKVELR